MFCSLFGYSKQAYYKQTRTGVKNEQMLLPTKDLVLLIRSQMPCLGTRKLYYLLKDQFDKQKIHIGRDKLFDLLRSENLLVRKRKKNIRTTNSKHWMLKYPNLIKQLDIIRPEQVWVADITYLKTREQTVYLHLLTDAYSKRIMGYELCDNLEAYSSHKALLMALKNRRYPDKGLVHHSDRGFQYCSKLYTNTLKNNNIEISMTENSDPYENAIAERVNGILKDEFGISEVFNDIEESIWQTYQSINIYNNLRPHLSCNMLTPDKMHKQNKLKRKTWKKKLPSKFME